MDALYGKLFQNIKEHCINSLPYNIKQDYYSYVEGNVNNGFRQVIITSEIMLAIIEHFLVNHKSKLVNIEFLVEDDELNEEINVFLKKMESNGAVWATLKERLNFVSYNDSIDIKKIELKCLEEYGFMISIQVNGIFWTSRDKFEDVSQEIIEIVQRYVK